MRPSDERTDAHAAEGRAPGKVILFGEHAVVHGQPAIAAPLVAVQASAHAEPALPGAGMTIEVPALHTSLAVPHGTVPLDAPLYHAVVYPAQLALQVLDAPPPDLSVTVRSTIPIASGLGSGAALAAAIIRAVTAALGAPLADDALNALVYEVEKRHHGNPSGIDNTVIVYERPVYYVRGRAIENVRIGAPFRLLLADSGQPSPTHAAVEDVGRLYAARPEMIGPVFEQIGETARAARRALEWGDANRLGLLMTENHGLLRQLSVSSEVLDRLCAAALEAGARGAKLSGGGRGGHIIALVDAASAAPVEHALRSAGAAAIIQTTIPMTL